MTDQKQEMIKREASTPAAAERASARPTFVPAVDIYETPTGTVLLADMPGVDGKSVDITLDEGVLTITGRGHSVEVADHELAYSEYRSGDYERSFSLADTVDRARIEASVQNGVLRIALPKSEEAKPKKIPVKFG